MARIFLHNLSVSLFELTKLHPAGNKFFKLKLNLIEARQSGYKTILSFGGAWSNHIHALSRMGRDQSFKTVGVIRGERPPRLSAMLVDAASCGMQLEFVSRQQYQRKEDMQFIAELQQKFGEFYLLPEGGSNHLAVAGCREIVGQVDLQIPDYDLICVPVGTGGTIAGIASAMAAGRQVMGIVVLKGAAYLDRAVERLIQRKEDPADEFLPGRNWSLNHDYHCGGYARCPAYLEAFIVDFERQYDIQLDPVYNAKMLYGMSKMIEAGKIKTETRIVLVHTGGLQGRRGFDF